jgi:hypothetical protein
VKKKRRQAQGIMSGSTKKPKRTGRPPLDNAVLLGRRDTFVSVLESSWADFGWGLKKARSISAVREALSPLKGQGLAYSLDVFLEESPTRASAKELRATKRTGWEASWAAREARDPHDRQVQLVTEARSALAQTENQSKARRAVEVELAKRQRELNRLASELKEASERRERLDRERHRQEAFVAQTELLRFVRSRRYAFTPRNLANVMAGLPYVGWRHSIRRCRKFPCQIAVSTNYQVFEAIAHILRGQRPKSSGQALEVFRAELPKLGRKHAHARSYIAENWSYLKEAIEECWKGPSRPRSRPFTLTSAFARSLRRPRTALERVLASQEVNLIDPKLLGNRKP